MSRNFASLPFFREIGYFPKKLKNDNSDGFDSEKGFAKSFNQRHMKNIYCLNSAKYLLPGELEPEVPPYAVEYCTAPGCEYIFAVADEDGIVALFSSIQSKSDLEFLKPLHKLHAHNNAIFDISWVPGENYLSTASGDHTAKLWDTIRGEVVTTFKGHSCSLKSISASKQNKNLLVTGSRDGNALLWDRRHPQPILRIQDAHVINDGSTLRKKRRRLSTTEGQLVNDSQQSVSCVLFQDTNTIISAGARDGALKLWDIRKVTQTKKSSAKNKSQPIETIPYPGNSLRRRGYTCLTLDSSNTHLYASCTDDSIYHYNLATSSFNETRQPICRYHGHYNMSFYVRTALSPDDQFLLSGSGDSKAYIWAADGKCESPSIHLTSEVMSEVTAVAWCPNDITHLVTCSDECAVRVWNLPYAGKSHIKQSNIDGTAETVKGTILGCKCGCDFSPISVISKPPTQPTSGPHTADQIFTPKKVSTSTSKPTSLMKVITPSRNLTQTSVTAAFTPPKGNIFCGSPSTSRKPRTPLRDSSNTVKTPTSIEKWVVRSSSKSDLQLEQTASVRKRAAKSLESRLECSESEAKENDRATCSKATPEKDWLSEHARKIKLGSTPPAKRQKRVRSMPTPNKNDDTASKKQKSTIQSYFKGQ